MVTIVMAWAVSAQDTPNHGIQLEQIPESYCKGNVAFPVISQLVQCGHEGHQMKVAMMMTSED